MRIKRRNVLPGLVGLGLPIIASSCTSTPSASSSSSSAGATASASSANSSAPEKIRIGYQVIPNAELLAKAL